MRSGDRGQGMEAGGWDPAWVRLISAASLTCLVSLIAWHAGAEAAVSKGSKQQLESSSTNQGGGTVSSSRFHQQSSIGEAIAGNRMSSSRFRVIPGFLGAVASTAQASSVSELDLSILYAKTDPLGSAIAPQTWQKDRDPLYLWEPPGVGLDLAGYSYAIDGAPDEVVDTTATSFDVTKRALGPLADGKHTFSVKAVNTAGNAGKPISIELWVDASAPQITIYSPSASVLLNTTESAVSATVLDLGSGVDASRTTLLLNGTSVPVTWIPATGVLTGRGGTWKEGANSLELRVVDVVGNAQVPLVWSVTVDTKPPVGSIVINAGSTMTTTIHVTLGLSASDGTSGVARILLSNDELTGYVEEPYVALRELWKLNAVRGQQRVYVKFVDRAGNISEPLADDIMLDLLAPETMIVSGPAGFTPSREAAFVFQCPEGECAFSYAFDGDEWSDWTTNAIATKSELTFGNHYFRVKAAKEVNGIAGIQPDEEDPSPAERTWVVGVEPSILNVPKGPPVKVWRLE